MTPPPYTPDDEHEPITGSFKIPATMRDVKDAKKSVEHRATLLFVLGALGTLGGGFLSVRAIAQDAGSAPAAKVAADLSGVIPRVTALEQGQIQQRADTHELQVDIRELYRAQRTGRKSERLEQPAPVPKSPDGGQ